MVYTVYKFKNILTKRIFDRMTTAVSSPDKYKTSRVMYIIAALLEYLISLTVTGAYLAKVTTTIGISDSLTGILTAFVSLGTCFQLLAVFIPKRLKVKSYVLPMHLVNQLCFTFLYVIPFFNVSREFKSVLFVIFMLLGHGIANIISPGKVNWLQSFIAPHYRGVFTAKKEIVSLFGGMAFSLVMGNMIDYFEEKGELYTAFIICAVTIFVLMISHTLTLFFTKDSDASAPGNSKYSTEQKYSFIDMMKDKTLMKISVIFVLFNIAHYSAVPFYGTYQINELGFSMGYVSLLTVVYGISRSIFSIPFGRIADKYSFRVLLTLCFIIDAAAYFVNTFTVPVNGKIFYTTYYILAAIAMAGINSGSLNILYEYMPPEKRTGALAFKSSVSGIVGFLITLLASPLVKFIQERGNILFGKTIYAQQVLSAFACLVTITIIIYLNTVIKKMSKPSIE